MRQIKYLLFILLLTSSLSAQLNNVRVFYEVTTQGTQVDFYVHTTSGTANLSGLNFGMYIQNVENNFVSLDATPASSSMGWVVTGNFTSNETPVGAYSKLGNTYDILLEMQIIDGNNGTSQNVTTTPKKIATVTFDISPLTPLNGGPSAIAETSDIPSSGFTLFDSNFNTGDVVGSGILSQVLPIKLRDFTVNKFGNERASDINWSSSSEINSAYFDIERSIDGYTFNAIGNVLAAGNSTTEQFYSIIDRNLPTSRGSQDVFYYRLKMVDLDGKFEYSDVRSVRFDNDSDVEFNTYPNPTAGKVYVKMSTPDTDETEFTQALIYDLSGRLVIKKDVSTKGITEIDMDYLTNGSYNINISHNGKTYQNRVIKTN